MTTELKNAMIYKIYYINDPNIIYIGSSMNNQTSKRWADHKADYKKYLNNPKNNRANIYPYFKEYGIENFNIVKIKDIQVVDRAHLKVYEQLFINKLKPVNLVNPFNILTDVDKKNYAAKYYEKNKDLKREYGKNRYLNNPEYFANYAKENKEKIKEYKKQHYEKNKEKILEKQNNYRKENKEKIKERKKEDYEKNKEKILKKKSEYYYRNKEEISKKIKEKITCEVCNLQVTRGHYTEHTRSKKHITNLNNQ